jgi:hypothetical protein
LDKKEAQRRAKNRVTILVVISVLSWWVIAMTAHPESRSVLLTVAAVATVASVVFLYLTLRRSVGAEQKV